MIKHCDLIAIAIASESESEQARCAGHVSGMWFAGAVQRAKVP
ncbi:hypothetical protein AAKU67_003814 [Oxalobacteraceae bacterium GrIS 2.11]